MINLAELKRKRAAADVAAANMEQITAETNPAQWRECNEVIDEFVQALIGAWPSLCDEIVLLREGLERNAKRAAEVEPLRTTVIALLEILRQWEPDHASAEERQTILQAMYLVGIIHDPFKTVAAMKVGAGETVGVAS